MLGWLAVAAVLAVATAGLLWARRHLLLVAVVGRSMEPTLRSGDRVLARRLPLARVRPGDVVVVVAPARMTAGHPTRPDAPGGPGLLIKRAHAVPGDPVPVDRVPLLRQGGERVVPTGRLVVLGDNAAELRLPRVRLHPRAGRARGGGPAAPARGLTAGVRGGSLRMTACRPAEGRTPRRHRLSRERSSCSRQRCSSTRSCRRTSCSPNSGCTA